MSTRPAPPRFAASQARLFAAAGVDKIRLTGGEPTLRPDLVDITAGLSALPGVKAVGLTSNGLTLGRKLPALKDAGAAARGGGGPAAGGRCARGRGGGGTLAAPERVHTPPLLAQSQLAGLAACFSSLEGQAAADSYTLQHGRRETTCLVAASLIRPRPLPRPTAGLSLLNISLDTLQPERFVAMTRRQGHDRVLRSIWQAAELGFDPGAHSMPLRCRLESCWAG